MITFEKFSTKKLREIFKDYLSDATLAGTREDLIDELDDMVIKSDYISNSASAALLSEGKKENESWIQDIPHVRKNAIVYFCKDDENRAAIIALR